MFKKIFAAIFGSADNTKTVVDGAVNGLDKLFYTDEEKAESAKDVREWFLRYLNATNPQNVSRRWIAVIVTLLWSLLIVYGVGAFTVEAFFCDAEPCAAPVAEFTFRTLTDIVTVPFGGIMAFYFVTHVVRSAKKDG